ncbi:nitrite reductase large subunit NirB [Paenibacillus pasadenensis]|uniref:nitrite reductase large subunit NirB n=1 Tax=Paenibacillus pasadenensis TaxID=217090 RepID=UPI00204230A3|nr:nitrite reductase large subunit NirB [Paenibacillus pasadenensis]MCM3748641.1 nitrite reductase large subunit NirB [Paenibacillus pasadenensis]
MNTSNSQKLVMIGNGMAGIRCIEHLLKLAPDAYEITVFGAEPHPNYNRIQLSTVLADGGSGLQDIVLNDWSWYAEHGITLHVGHTVTSIDTQARTVASDQGLTVSYDVLLIATGSRAFMLPVSGADKEGVIGFRDIRDCETMLEASRTYRRAAVIGGGLLGLEAARGLLNLGMDVTVIHNSSALMNRQLDPPASHMLRHELEMQGMKFLTNMQTREITGADRVTGISFKDGSFLETDLVVMAVGITPNAELAARSGIAVKRGVLVGDDLSTSVPGVYALGECAEHNGITYGLVAPLYEQGAVLAKHLAGVHSEGYKGSVTSTKLKVSGVDVFSAGDYIGLEGTRSLSFKDEVDAVYKKLVLRGDLLEGVVLFGDINDGPMLFNLMKTGESVAGREKQLLLGFAPGATSAASPLERLSAMPGDEIVCGCNGVSKDDIVDAIASKGCTSLSAVKSCTKASASCGGCKPLVEDLLTLTAGDSVVKAKEGICGCTPLDRNSILEAINAMGLTSVKETMNVLEWSQPEGCSKCRPALNYYLGMLKPGEYRDQKESRFTNERYHANIQKDGTYSVVPRIYGGVTSPAELKHIADVAERFQVPLVKFTGGQRLDLLGVRKEDLPRMWEELGMASGSAYGKALRTVKTCVGDTFCRFGTQDAMGMGIKLEKAFERISTPAKFKMAVSGCPRNCAEATIKDFGVVAIDGGWELHAGGNGGVKVRATDLLTVVRTEEEVMEWSGAYLQYYRENANWNERTAHWVDRIGIDAIREALSDRDERLALVDRLQTALSGLEDPWHEIVDNAELRKNFEPLAAAGRNSQ